MAKSKKELKKKLCMLFDGIKEIDDAVQEMEYKLIEIAEELCIVFDGEE